MSYPLPSNYPPATLREGITLYPPAYICIRGGWRVEGGGGAAATRTQRKALPGLSGRGLAGVVPAGRNDERTGPRPVPPKSHGWDAPPRGGYSFSEGSLSHRAVSQTFMRADPVENGFPAGCRLIPGP